jgi:hypothetical protein
MAWARDTENRSSLRLKRETTHMCGHLGARSSAILAGVSCIMSLLPDLPRRGVRLDHRGGRIGAQ